MDTVVDCVFEGVLMVHVRVKSSAGGGVGSHTAYVPQNLRCCWKRCMHLHI